MTPEEVFPGHPRRVRTGVVTPEVLAEVIERRNLAAYMGGVFAQLLEAASDEPGAFIHGTLVFGFNHPENPDGLTFELQLIDDVPAELGAPLSLRDLDDLATLADVPTMSEIAEARDEAQADEREWD